MRQAYDYWQDQPGFAGGQRDLEARPQRLDEVAPAVGGTKGGRRKRLEGWNGRLEHVERPPHKGWTGGLLPGWRVKAGRAALEWAPKVGGQSLEPKGWRPELGAQRLEARAWSPKVGGQSLEPKGWSPELGAQRLEARAWSPKVGGSPKVGAQSLEPKGWSAELGAQRLELGAQRLEARAWSSKVGAQSLEKDRAWSPKVWRRTELGVEPRAWSSKVGGQSLELKGWRGGTELGAQSLEPRKRVRRQGLP